MEGVAAFLLLALDVGGSGGGTANTPRCVAQALLEALVECGNIGLCLPECVVEMRQLGCERSGW